LKHWISPCIFQVVASLYQPNFVVVLPTWHYAMYTGTDCSNLYPKIVTTTKEWWYIKRFQTLKYTMICIIKCQRDI
jgi:hypothetical protein